MTRELPWISVDKELPPEFVFTPEPDQLADMILAYIGAATYRTLDEIQFKFNEPDVMPVLDRLIGAGRVRPVQVPDVGGDGRWVWGWEVCR